MFSLFQNRHPLAFLFLIPLVVLLGVVNFWFSEENTKALTLIIWQKSFTLKSLEIAYLYTGLLALNGVVLSIIFNRLNLIEYFSHIAGLFYVSFSFATVSLNESHVLFADLFLLIGFWNLVQIKNNADAKAPVFNSSFFIGIACLINPFNVPLLALIFLTLMRTRSFVFREYFTTFLAWSALGMYIAFYYYFYELKISSLFSKTDSFVEFNYNQWVIIVCIIMLALLSFVTRYRFQGSPGIRIERIVRIIFLAFVLQSLFIIILTFFKFNVSLQGIVFLALYAGYAYNFTKVRVLYQLLTYSCLLTAVLQHLDLF